MDLLAKIVVVLAFVLLLPSSALPADPPAKQQPKAVVKRLSADAETGRQIQGFIKSGNLSRLKGAVRKDPNKFYPGFGTAMHIAAREGDIKSVDLLLAAGADINTAPTDGTTPFLSACATRSAEFLRQLVERGANVQAKQTDGETKPGFNALHAAVFSRNAAAIHYLATMQIDINELDPMTGFTPLGLAVAFDCRDCVVALLKAGADPKKKNADGTDEAQQCKTNRLSFCNLL